MDQETDPAYQVAPPFASSSSSSTMGSGIALDDAAVVSTSLEAILYGLSLLMFILTIWVLTCEERRHTSNRMMITIAVVFLMLSTAHMIVDIVRIHDGLVMYRDTFPGGPSAFFADIAQNTFVAKNAIYTLQTLVGDSILIYRCYVVWQTIWIVLLPTMLWCGIAATGVGAVYSVSRATVEASNIFAEETAQWITAFFALTLTTNLLSTSLLAYRIWTIERNAASIRTSKMATMMPILRIILDAALLYSATLLAALLCFVNDNNGQYVVLDLIMPIISIAFYMVLIRIAIRQRDIQRRVSSMLKVSTTTGSQETRPLQQHVL